MAYDVTPDREFAAAHGISLVAADELLAKADFLSLHCPVLPETRGLVNEAFLNSMKPGAFLVNTARGELVDEASLLAALQSGRLRGAALDVYSQEPPGAREPTGEAAPGHRDAAHRFPRRRRDERHGPHGAGRLPGGAAGREAPRYPVQ